MSRRLVFCVEDRRWQKRRATKILGAFLGCAGCLSAAAIKCGDAASVKSFQIWKAVAGAGCQWWWGPLGT